MADVSLDLSRNGIRDVLAGLALPAYRWKIVAHAQYWGATPRCVNELTRLPVRLYRNVGDVVSTLRRMRDPVNSPRFGAPRPQ